MQASSVRTGDVRGAPGRTGAAHIMQFRPVGVERPREEVLPERLEFSERQFSERPGLSVTAGRRGRKGWRSDGCHDAVSVLPSRPLPPGACFGAENELW